MKNIGLVEQLLDKYSPSELDEAVKTVCPFFEQKDRNFTSAYLDFHEYCKVGVLTRLQTQFENFEVFAEEETENGRVDGSVHSVGLENTDVFLYNEGQPSEKIALVEVKSGSDIKPLQSCSYTYQEKTPTIIAEVKRGCCHLVDQETAGRLLGFAAEQMEILEELKEKNQKIPDSYRCGSCINESCRHWNKENSAIETRYIIRDRTEQLIENLSDTVDELIKIVEGLLEEKGFSTLR